MISVKDAAQRAAEFARTVLADNPEANAWGSQVRLEEVETGHSQGRRVWFITLSIPDSANALAAFAGQRSRLYKSFAVDTENGEVLSMKIRQLASVE
jgi:hypothetical protein